MEATFFVAMSKRSPLSSRLKRRWLRLFSLFLTALITVQAFPAVGQIVNQQTLEAANNNPQQQPIEGTIPGIYYDPSGVVAPTFSSSSAGESAGSLVVPPDSQAPSYLNTAWPANATADQVLTIGNLQGNPQFDQFRQKNINEILTQTGKDPATVTLSEVPIASSVTLDQYLQINPGAAEVSVDEAPPVVQAAVGYYDDEPLVIEPIDQTDTVFIEEQAARPEISDIPAEDLLEGDWGDVFTPEDQSKLEKTLSKVNEKLKKLPLKQIFPLVNGVISGDWDAVKKQAKQILIQEGSKILVKELLKNPTIAKAIKDLPLGTLQTDKLSLTDAPGLGESALGDIPGADDKPLNQVPGLGDIPLDQIELALALSFTRVDLLGVIDTTDAAAVVDNISYTISGGTKDQIPRPTPCKIDGKDTKNCRHFELDNLQGGGKATDLSGKAWVQGSDQKVEGGKGWLRVFANGKEPTGVKPWIAGPVKLILEDIKEGVGGEKGSARLSTAWQFCYSDPITGLHCTPHFIVIPTPYRVKEGGIMLLLARSGGVPAAIAALSPGNQLSQIACQTQNNIVATNGNLPGGDTKYGHQAYADTKEKTYQVTSVDGVDEGLTKDAAEAFEQMRGDAADQGLDIRAVSGYRSKELQQGLWDNQVEKQGSEAAAAKISAPPGHSEHHTGLAVDVGNNQNPYLNNTWAETSEYQWMKQNAEKYGYELSFPEDGSGAAGFEPWHWRFVGTDQARQTFEKPKGQGSTLLASSGTTDSKDYDKPSDPQKNIAQYLARIARGESSGGINTGSHPKTGATGEYQFIPETRQAILNNHGYDAWSTDKNERDQAVLSLIRDFGNQGNVNEDIIGHIENGDFARADQLLGQHVRDGNGKVIRYGQFTSLPGGAEAHADWNNPALLEQYGPDGDVGTNAPDSVVPCNPGNFASDGYVPIGPEGDGIATGRLSNPIPGGIVTSEFGHRVPPCYGCSEFHPAIDIDLHDNSPILAADGGTVDFAGLNGGYGYQIFINHGNGLGTWYAHNSQLNVKVGDKVKQGQQIAVIGQTGNGTGVHLDFGVIEGYQSGNIHSGTAVDPRKHVKF